VEEIVELLETHGLIEKFLDAIPELSTDKA
jgi:hypothetical protein